MNLMASELEAAVKLVKERCSRFRSDYQSNEQAVRTQLIEPILRALGWDTHDPEFVRPNAVNDEGKIPDYRLRKSGKDILVLEAKNISIDLNNNKIIDQIAQYCYSPGIEFGVLTNGLNWLLFSTFERNPKERIVWKLSLESAEVSEVVLKLSSFSFDQVNALRDLILLSKVRESSWDEIGATKDKLIALVAERLLAKIVSNHPGMKGNVPASSLFPFVETKMQEIFQSNSLDAPIVPEKIASDESEDTPFERPTKSKIRQKIRVKFPDGHEICRQKVVDTFVEVIIKVGLENVAPLEIKRSGVHIVSQTKSKDYAQHRHGKYFIMTHSSTQDKFKMITSINEQLGLGLQIDLVD